MVLWATRQKRPCLGFEQAYSVGAVSELHWNSMEREIQSVKSDIRVLLHYGHNHTSVQTDYNWTMQAKEDSCLFCDRVPLCNSPGCPRTCSVDHAGLKLTDIPPGSASLVLGLKTGVI